MPTESGEPESGDHIIICGANALTVRIAEELTLRYGLAVTAIVPSAATGHGARLGTVVVFVHDLDRSVEFYADILELGIADRSATATDSSAASADLWRLFRKWRGKVATDSRAPRAGWLRTGNGLGAGGPPRARNPWARGGPTQAGSGGRGRGGGG